MYVKWKARIFERYKKVYDTVLVLKGLIVSAKRKGIHIKKKKSS